MVTLPPCTVNMHIDHLIITWTKSYAALYMQGVTLTDDNSENHKDDDNQDDPQLNVLPPELTFESGGCTLEHVSILV